MLKEEWAKRITSACEKARTYEDYYDDVIDTLAGILEKRDNAEDVFYKSGGHPVIQHTNKAGATNTAKNPALVIVTELNQQALAYWRELGLTPSGLKKLNAEVVKAKNEGSLEKLLEKITL